MAAPSPASAQDEEPADPEVEPADPEGEPADPEGEPAETEGEPADPEPEPEPEPPVVTTPSTDTVRAGQLQSQADEAYARGELEEALRLATRAVELDAGASTWLAQQIRIEVLEKQGELEGALTHLGTYLAVDGLFPEHLAWGDEAKVRLEAARTGQLDERTAIERSRRGKTALGTALVVGGAFPLAIGVSFVANFAFNDGDVEHYGGWLDSGLVAIGVGAGLEVAGIVVLASIGGRQQTVSLSIHPVLPGPRSRRSGVVLIGRF